MVIGTQQTKDIITLLQREADLLSRNMKPSVFTGLRKRLLNLFLQVCHVSSLHLMFSRTHLFLFFSSSSFFFLSKFCETPEFNPEAARFMDVHKTPEEMLQAGFQRCPSCCQFRKTEEFDVR